MANTIRESRNQQEEFAVYPRADYARREAALVSRGAEPDPSVRLDAKDPRVGRVFFWGGDGRYRAQCRAVVYVNDEAESLLLEDWTGWPWVRVDLDAEAVP